MLFSLFLDTVLIISILPSRKPIRDPSGPILKANYMLNFNNYSTKRPI